jgi:hypothetical protein
MGGIIDPTWVASRSVWKAACTLCGWSIETDSEPECERNVRFHEEGHRHRRRMRRAVTTR